MERFHSDSDRVYWEKASLDLIKADFPTAKIAKSPPEKQALNGYIEEGVEAVVKNAKAVMADAPHMPKFLWESANSTIKQMNKTATAGHPTKTPDERWSGEIPDFTRDVPWGTRCWFVATTTERKKGWDPRWADSGVPGFVVDSDPSGGYWVYNPKTKKIRLRYDVYFDPINKPKRPSIPDRIEFAKQQATSKIPESSDQESLPQPEESVKE